LNLNGEMVPLYGINSAANAVILNLNGEMVPLYGINSAANAVILNLNGEMAERSNAAVLKTVDL
jgi:hypothetical protein